MLLINLVGSWIYSSFRFKLKLSWNLSCVFSFFVANVSGVANNHLPCESNQRQLSQASGGSQTGSPHRKAAESGESFTTIDFFNSILFAKENIDHVSVFILYLLSHCLLIFTSFFLFCLVLSFSNKIEPVFMMSHCLGFGRPLGHILSILISDTPMLSRLL